MRYSDDPEPDLVLLRDLCRDVCGPGAIAMSDEEVEQEQMIEMVKRIAERDRALLEALGEE